MIVRPPTLDAHELIYTGRLPNGVLVLTEVVPEVESVALGVWTDAGSEQEAPDAFGISHFLEHMFFKGTASRSAFALAEEIENVGGHRDAYTGEEMTHISFRVLAEHLPVAVDLLADMVCHSTFDAAEMDRERQVIIEEIRKYDSMPEEHIRDLLMEGLWHGGGLGHSILGTEDSVRGFTRDDLVNCRLRHFSTDRVIITAAGRLDHDALMCTLADAFADLPAPGLPAPPAPEGTRLPLLAQEKDEEQVNFCWGGRTYPADDDRNYALDILNSVLGASDTSRLFQEIREKRGLVYDIGSVATSFRRTGLLCVSGATSPDTFLEVLELAQREMLQLRRDSITTRELARAKEQMKSGLALAMESTWDRMRRLAMHVMTWGKVYPLRYLIEKMSQVTDDDVRRVADEVLDLDTWTFASIGPISGTQITSVLGSGSDQAPS